LLNGINVPTVDKIVDVHSPKFHKVQQSSTTSVLQVAESKEAKKGNAPAPKADSGLAQKCPIFSSFCFNEMRVAC
jgi:hypothetical protein